MWLWLLMVATIELGTYQPVDVLSMDDGVLGALVVTGYLDNQHQPEHANIHHAFLRVSRKT
jgi:hypothetical protein